MTTPNNSTETPTSNHEFLLPLVDPLLAAIRQERGQQRLTQTDLGARLGISGAAISQFENGQHSPTLATLRKVLTVLDCDIVLVKNVQSDDPTGGDPNRRLLHQIAALLGYTVTPEPID